jgi:hypothetical protein
MASTSHSTAADPGAVPAGTSAASGRKILAVGEMTRVFLCHNSKDKDEVKNLALVILKGGAIRAWLDTWEIPGGKDWEDHIRREFAASWSCIVLVGPHGLGPFQRKELEWAKVRAAVDTDYRVVPVLLPGVNKDALVELDEVLPRIHAVSLEQGWSTDEHVALLLKALRGDRPGPPAFAISVAVSAEQWDAALRRDDGAMLRGRALKKAQQMMGQPGVFDALSVAFIASSAAAQESRTRRMGVLLGGLAVAFLGLALLANNQRLAAVDSKREAELQRDAASAAQVVAERERGNAEAQKRLAEQRRDVAESQALAAEARRRHRRSWLRRFPLLCLRINAVQHSKRKRQCWKV